MLHPVFQKRYQSAIAVLKVLNQASPQDNLEECLNVIKSASSQARNLGSVPHLAVVEEDQPSPKV
jgi:hypothetical protein